MRLTFRISLLAIGLAALLGPGAASAGALVEFPNLPGHTPANLSGYLARPDAGLSAELGDLSNGGVPFPAVVAREVVAPAPSAPCRRTDGSQTLCWRERDSNPRSPVKGEDNRARKHMSGGVTLLIAW
jgi:hypothetical protein